MPRLRRLPVALASLATAGLSARTAAAQLVMGRVVDSASRRPLPAVPVRLVRVAGDGAGPDTASVARGHTARDGVFTLAAPGPGTYRLHVAGGVAGPPLALASADSVDQREYAVTLDYGAPVLAELTDKPATSVPGTLLLRYPPHLVPGRVTGCAALEFVVDTLGRAEPATFQVLVASRPEFAQSAAAAAVAGRYRPAERDGRLVRGVVRMPFTFAINSLQVTRRAECLAAAGGGAPTLVEVHAYVGGRRPPM